MSASHTEYVREHRKNNPEMYRNASQKWRENNLEKWQFACQRQSAKRRGIEFNLTFEEWTEFWGDDLDKRGKQHGQLVMGRVGDEGAYELGNIMKITNIQNGIDIRNKQLGRTT